MCIRDSLGTDEHPYTGNVWNSYKDKLRIERTTNGTAYYLIEGDTLRIFPDNETLTYISECMHLDVVNTKLLSHLDRSDYPIGPPIVSRKDGTIVRGAKQKTIYHLQGGKKCAIPSMDKFSSMGNII